MEGPTAMHDLITPTGFSESDVWDMIGRLEGLTVKRTLQILDDIGYSETFYLSDQSYPLSYTLGGIGGAFTLDKFREYNPKIGHYFANEISGVTFQGGPTGEKWLTLNLECLLIDKVSWCVVHHGPEITYRCLGDICECS